MIDPHTLEQLEARRARLERERRGEPDPTAFTLEEWKRMHGTRTGTFTINGVRYTDLTEVEWRQANCDWSPADG